MHESPHHGEAVIPDFGCRVPLKLEYGFGYIIKRSSYIPYSIYLRGTIGFKSEIEDTLAQARKNVARSLDPVPANPAHKALNPDNYVS